MKSAIEKLEVEAVQQRYVYFLLHLVWDFREFVSVLVRPNCNFNKKMYTVSSLIKAQCIQSENGWIHPYQKSRPHEFSTGI